MPQLTNPTNEALTVQGVGRIDAGASVEITDEQAAAFVDHPVLVVSADQPAAPAPAPAPAPEVPAATPEANAQ